MKRRDTPLVWLANKVLKLASQDYQDSLKNAVIRGTTCIRGAGHPPPCNGFPTVGCPVLPPTQDALDQERREMWRMEEPIPLKSENRILWNSGDNDIDEIVVCNPAVVHIEQMSDDCWWVGITIDEDRYWAGNFSTDKKGKMSFWEQEREGSVWDREDSHEGSGVDYVPVSKDSHEG